MTELQPLRTNAEREALFGHIAYTSAPTKSNPEGIRITNDWVSRYIVVTEIPQLALIPGIMHRGQRVGAGPASGRVRCHRAIADQLTWLWAAWETAGLLDRVLTWAGLWNPRFIRGSRHILSSHAYATSFDINAPWNGLRREPAALGKRGCVRELVPIAEEHGLFWGGNFKSRKDAMHFEAAKILTEPYPPPWD
jgi:hypothetical protein